MKNTIISLIILIVFLFSNGCSNNDSSEEKQIKVCFSFQDLETEFWVAAHAAITNTLQKNNIEVIERNASQDANRQFEQIRDAIAQGVDGIIFIPQDGQSAVTIIKEANKANVPIAVFNRPPSDSVNSAIVVVADNRSISEKTVSYMVSVVEETGKRATPCILVGDLGDKNSIERRNGFYDALNGKEEFFNEVIEVPTKWDPNIALANFEAALQSNPNIDFVFLSSDFLYPQVKAVLEPIGKWQQIGNPNHVIIGGIDGDRTACILMKDKYVDVTGVQDLYFEADAITKEIMDAIKNKNQLVKKWIRDPGFALTQKNYRQKHEEMWGCK